jgi:hypothetical protein
MRSASGGELLSKNSEAKLPSVNRRELWADAAKRFLPRDLTTEDVKTTRAKEYASPTHNARTTRAYSVSFPVCNVRSQWSNVSSSGHTRQTSKISVTVI